MGVQCSIILTYATRHYKEAEQIAAILNVDELNTVDAIGNRNWEPNDSVFHAISMKSWSVEECEAFFSMLRQKVDWDMPYTVQLYWQPAAYKHYTPFIYEPLFPELFKEF